MRVNLPNDTSLHVAPGLEISMRSGGVHVRSRHRTKMLAGTVLSVILAGAGGWVWGSWDRIATDTTAEVGPDPASLQAPALRSPASAALPGVQSAAARPAPTVVQSAPHPAAAPHADPFGLAE